MRQMFRVTSGSLIVLGLLGGAVAIGNPLGWGVVWTLRAIVGAMCLLVAGLISFLISKGEREETRGFEVMPGGPAREEGVVARDGSRERGI